jgi:N-acetylglucosaminyldiphosphoundecaprenol N-acetyl-beta-D-mannosaminyltransferase
MEFMDAGTGTASRLSRGARVAPDLPPRCYVGEVGISIVTMSESLRLLTTRARERQPAYVCVTGVNGTVLAQRDPEFCRIQNASFLTVPDGMPLIWYARMMGERRMERVSGPDLMMETLRLSEDRGYTHYFYGDTEETLGRMRRTLADRYPRARIAGTYSPPFRPLTDSEMNATVDEINRLRPTFVWVGLGCPKQERWMARVFPRMESSILLGVGAAFRFLIGEYRHPPRVIQFCGLEGIFWRVRHRPGYVVRWYAHHVPAFGSLLLKGFTKRLTTRRCGSA